MNFAKITFISLCLLVLSGCGTPLGANTPYYIEFTDSGNGDIIDSEGNDKILIRSFAVNHNHFYRVADLQVISAGTGNAKYNPNWKNAGYTHGPMGNTYLDKRYNDDKVFGRALPYVLPFVSAPALGVQIGDLVDFVSKHNPGHSLEMDRVALFAVRIVCKFYDEECIQRERRDYACDNGAMVINDARREDKPCGGFGNDSEDWAAFIGPVDELYGSVDGYLKQHGSPWTEECLIKTMGCGADQGLAVTFAPGEKWGDYVGFNQRFPNYQAAQITAHNYVFGGMFLNMDEHKADRQLAKRLSENMFSRK